MCDSSSYVQGKRACCVRVRYRTRPESMIVALYEAVVVCLCIALDILPLLHGGIVKWAS